MAKMSGSRLFAEVIHGYGVTHVFYVPTILMRALAEMDDFKIHKIMTHGEKAAAYMADGYARASGKPGVCMAQQIGASNLAAGLRDGFMACSPMIAISGGSVPRLALSPCVPGSRGLQPVRRRDQVQRAGRRRKAAARLDAPGISRSDLRRARPCASAPQRIARRLDWDAEADLTPLVEERFKQVPAFRPEPEPSRVREALAVLAKAQRPMIVAGGGVVFIGRAGRARRIRREVADTGHYVAQCKGGDRSTGIRSNVGVAGVYSRSCANKALAEADLVFFIGSHTGGQLTTSWKVPEPGVTVIQLDIDPEELGRNYPNAVSLIGDAKVDIASSDRCGRQAGSGRASMAGPGAGTRRRMARGRRTADDFKCNADAARARMPRNFRGAAGGWRRRVRYRSLGHVDRADDRIQQPAPGVSCAARVRSAGACPARSASSVRCPNRAVVCFTGDGGAYYHLAELETAARYGINLVVVVNNNSSLNQEIPLVNAAYKGKDTERSGEIWRFQKSVDFAKLGEALGCAAFRVDKPGQLKELLPKAFAMNRPVVIDVVQTKTRSPKTRGRPEVQVDTDLIAPGFERVVDRDPPLDSIAQG